MKNLVFGVMSLVSVFSSHSVFAQPINLAQPIHIASPNVSGNNGSVFPFDLGGAGLQSMRYQQVYASADFAAVMPLGGWITALRFDIATEQNGGHGFIATLDNLQIHMSTTSHAVDGLSTVFAQNVGPDDAMVLGASSITIMDDARGGADILIQFETPFFYNPSAGNLLMDVRNFGGVTTSPFNSNVSPSDTTSSVWALSAGETMGTLHTGGLVTRFEVTPVPEPSTWALAGLGAILFLFFRWRRASRVSED